MKLLDTPPTVLDVDGGPVGYDVRFRDAVMYILRRRTQRRQSGRRQRQLRLERGGRATSSTTRTTTSSTRPSTRPTPPTPRTSRAAGDPRRRPPATKVIPAAASRTAKITIPDSGEIVVPFELFDERGPLKKGQVRELHERAVLPDAARDLLEARRIATPNRTSTSKRGCQPRRPSRRPCSPGSSRSCSTAASGGRSSMTTSRCHGRAGATRRLGPG